MIIFERSSGSAATTKLIPYTQTLRSEFSAAIDAWLYNIYTTQRELLGTTSYFSVSSRSGEKSHSPGGIAIGFDDDTEYFSPAVRLALKAILAVSPAVARLRDFEEWQSETIIQLLNARDLGFISVWSPTFLIQLFKTIEKSLPELLPKLKPSRRREIEESFENTGKLDPNSIWPNLHLISAWQDGASAPYYQQLKDLFPKTLFQPKGLLATEGVVSIPIFGQSAPVLALTSHFFEFIDLEEPEKTPLLAHQLEANHDYSPLLTTGGGLYRYHLKDVVRCEGHWNKAPMLRFMGKMDGTSDLVGEKLNQHFVSQAIQRAFNTLNISPKFSMLSPKSSDKPYYGWFVESDASAERLERACTQLEEALCGNHHYGLARRLGQLGPVRLMHITDGFKKYQEVRSSQGAKLGDIKPMAIDVGGVMWG